MKVLLIDNYDSFTYNLVHYLEVINGKRPHVVRNDRIDIDTVNRYDCIVLSPGPGLPKDTGQLMEVLQHTYEKKVILGICLGHHAIGAFFGGELINLPQVYHGVQSDISNLNDDVFYRNIDSSLVVGRYHSWVLNEKSIPDELLVTSYDRNENIMSLRHRELPIHSVQYHPESILTPNGMKVLENFFSHYG